ncbi:vomeronasal type-2 receptor 26-like [Pelodytes ibericus]
MHGVTTGYCPFKLLLLFLCVTPYRSGIQSSAPPCHLQVKKSFQEYEYFKDGDIIIGGVFTVHRFMEEIEMESGNIHIKQMFCLGPLPNYYEHFLTFLYAIEEINNKNILPNMTLGYHVYDSCRDERKAVKSVIQILSGPRKIVPNYSCMERNKVAGFIGDFSAVTTLSIAQILEVYKYSLFSYGDSGSLLSDQMIYPHVFNALPHYHSLYSAISKILKYFGWTWVGIITSNEDGGEKDSQMLNNYLKSHGICVEAIIKVDYHTVLASNSRYHKNSNIIHMLTAHVVILSGRLSGAHFLEDGLRRKTVIIPPSNAINSDILKICHGALILETISFTIPDMNGFINEFYPSNHPDDIILEEIWSTAFLCASGNVSKDLWYESLYKNKLRNLSTSLGENGSVAQTLHHFLKDMKYKDPMNSYFSYQNGKIDAAYRIKNIIVRTNNSLLINQVGQFTPWAREDQQLMMFREIIWNNFENKIPRSQCSEDCLPGYRKAPKSGIHPCCYDCVQCSEGEISNVTDFGNCIMCPYNEWPNENKDQCIPRLEEFLSYNIDAIATVFMFVSVLFFLITFMILVIFISFRNTPIVKANNKSLSFVLLVSIMLSFPCVFLFLGRPVDITCMLRQTSFALTFSIAISCVLGKTVMIYIVFKATKPGSAWKNWLNIKIDNSVVFIFSSIQIIINIIWLIISPPFQELDTQSYPGKMIIQCNEGSVIAFYTVLGYMGFLAAVSFFIAFLSRTLPDSFNEAKYITFSMLVFCSVWIAMIPAYLSTKGKNMVVVEIFAILVSSAGLLVCIFFSKCYIIFYRPEMNTKTQLLRKNIHNIN